MMELYARGTTGRVSFRLFLETPSNIPNFIKLIHKKFRLPEKTESEIIKIIGDFNSNYTTYMNAKSTVAYERIINHPQIACWSDTRC